jgi:hypothetical protein
MITIFSDFCQFSAKNLAFFSQTIVMIKFLHNLHSFVLSQKRQFFRRFFSKNIFKIITSVPGLIDHRRKNLYLMLVVIVAPSEWKAFFLPPKA